MIYYIYYEQFEHEFIVELEAKDEDRAVEEAAKFIITTEPAGSVDAFYVLDSAAEDINDVDPYTDHVCKEYYRIELEGE